MQPDHHNQGLQRSCSCPHLTCATFNPCRLIYADQGPDAPNNGTLTAADKAALEGKTVEEVHAEIKATGGHAFSTGKSAYRGVSAKGGKWRARIRIPGGKNAEVNGFDTEEAAAHAYDAGARLAHGR